MNHLRVILVALLALLASCGEWGDEARRGGGIEIPNGVAAEVAVRITDSAGTPLARVQAHVIAGESWAKRMEDGKGVILDTLFTDSTGVVRVPVNESRVFLLVRDGERGIHMALYPRDSAGNGRSNPLPVPLKRMAHLLFKTQDPSQKVVLFGTPWELHPSSENGLMELDSLPSGEYMPVAVSSDGLRMGARIDALPFDTLTDVQSVIFSDPNNLHIANFENRRLLGIWDPVHVGGYWWATARVNDSASWDHFGMQTIDDLLKDSLNNTYAGVRVQFQKTGETMANFGLDFSTQPVNTHLENASHVEFLAKGMGTWVLYIQTLDSATGAPLRWKKELTLSNQWHLQSIALDELICETNPSLQWVDGVRLGTNLFWETSANGEIWIDDLVLKGLRFEDWVDP